MLYRRTELREVEATIRSAVLCSIGDVQSRGADSSLNAARIGILLADDETACERLSAPSTLLRDQQVHQYRVTSTDFRAGRSGLVLWGARMAFFLKAVLMAQLTKLQSEPDR